MGFAPTPATPTPVVPARATERPLAVLAILAAALLATTGVVGLFEPTETRYAEIAREMLASGEWLIPHLDGIAHLHKPPFAYWAVAAGMSAFGETAWAARLPVALATTLTLAFAWIAARRRFAPLGVSATATLWALGTMALPFAIGRTIATDPFLAMTVAGFWALAPSTAGIALLGLGFFIKGPVVLVPTLLPVLVAAAWARDRAALRVLGSGRAWLLCAAIALPWYVIMAVRVPGLLSYFVGNQLWARYATRAHHRGGPPWYFIAALVAGSLPWTAAMIAGLVRVVRVVRSGAGTQARLLLAWLLAPLAFFSFSGSKLPAYLLPCFPAAAMLAAIGIEHGGRAVRWITVATLAVLVAAGFTFGPTLLSRLAGAPAAAATGLPWPIVAGLAAWAVAASLLAVGRFTRMGAWLLLGWLGLVIGLAPYDAALGSPHRIAALLAEERTPGEPVVEYRRFNAGLPFHLREPVRLLDVERELFFTPSAARASVVATRDSITALASRYGRVWMLAPSGETQSLAESLGLDYTRVSVWNRQDLGFVEPPAGR